MTVSILYHTNGSSLSYQAWSSVIKSFELDHWEEIGNNYKTIESFMKKHDMVYVMLVPEGSIPDGIKPVELKHFIHPIREVCYVFGDEKNGIPEEDIKNADFVVTIKNKSSSLLSYIAAALTLYDRRNKMEMKN